MPNNIQKLTYFLTYLKLSLFKRLGIRIPKVINIAGFKVHYGDISQLSLLFREIFVMRNYACPLPPSALIIDGGANIGMAVLFFKKHYPDAKIIAFEPNPGSFALLKTNIEENRLSGVEIHHAALGSKDETLDFYIAEDMPTADIGTSVIKEHVDHFWGKGGKINKVKVKSRNLAPFIDRTVDLLKLDVEGSEARILTTISENFHRIKYSIMEYHGPLGNDENNLSDILRVMETNNHAYLISPVGRSRKIKKKRGYIIHSRKIE